MGNYLDKDGLTRFKEKMLTEVDKRIATGGGSTSGGDSPTKEEILEGAKRVTDVEVDASIATHEALQTAVARVESELNGAVRSVNGMGADASGNVKISTGVTMPDYNSIVSIGSFPYTAPTDGYIKVIVYGGNYGGISVNVNSKNDDRYFQLNGTNFNASAIFPINKGDVIYTHDNGVRYFIPCKVV